MAVTVFETFLEQDGPQDAKTGGDGEKFRMSERQRVRGTAVDSYFCEARGNLVSNTVMPPFIQKLLTLQNPFASFVCFAVRYQRPYNLLSNRENREIIHSANCKCKLNTLVK